MSELQTRFIDDTYVEYYNTGKHDLAQIYLKAEADKVIAEKNKEIAELKENQTWIKPSDKLPNENQEIEFIIRRKLFDDSDGVRMRVLGVYKQMFLNPQHCIFYASAPGWGSEFLPKEVEYWMPKIPMPLPLATKEDK